MSQPSVRTLVGFLRALAVLALPAPDQLAWLRSLGLPGEPAVLDELAMEFDDGYRLVPSFIKNGWLPESILDPLSELDRLLSGMSGTGNERVWLVDSLDSTQEWEEVRFGARKVLMLV